MNLRRIHAVFIARNREFLRDRSALTWNIVFPVMLVAAFAFAFAGGKADLFKVGLYRTTDVPLDFLQTDYLDFIPVSDRAAAVVKVDRHQFDMLIDTDNRQYWINSSSPKGYILERVLRASGGGDFVRETVNGPNIRYVDWVLPGVLAMNMMFSCLFGVGYVIVRYRKNGVLKRLRATPLTSLEFLVAQVVSRLWLILAVSMLIYVGMDLFINFTMHGSYWLLFGVFVLGATSLISLGLAIAARTASDELAGGLLNLLSWPMMMLSGVWFSLEGVHPWLQKLALIFPLTHLVTAARAIMIDGAGLADIAGHVGMLVLLTLLFLTLGATLFRWE